MNYYLTTDELYHHGILGQKWGVRRFQNKDGSLTPAGQKRLAKQISKATSEKKARSKIPEKVIENVMKDHSDKIVNSFNKYAESIFKEPEVYEEEFDKASSKAYDSAYKFLEKNDPDYLNEIVKRNNGEKAGLDGFHDFRKIYEGYEDEYLSDVMDKHHKKHKDYYDQQELYYKEYQRECENATKALVGEYGYLEVKKISGKMRSVKVKDIINDEINERLWRTSK